MTKVLLARWVLSLGVLVGGGSSPTGFRCTPWGVLLWCNAALDRRMGDCAGRCVNLLSYWITCTNFTCEQQHLGAATGGRYPMAACDAKVQGAAAAGRRSLGHSLLFPRDLARYE